MGAPGELPNLGGTKAAADVDVSLTTKRNVATDPAPTDASAQGTPSSLAKGDKGATAFVRATYEPTMSFEWGNINQIGAVAGSTGGTLPAAPPTLSFKGGSKPLQVAGDTPSFSKDELNGASKVVFAETGTSTSATAEGPQKASAKRLLQNAETLVSQLAGIETADKFSGMAMTRLKAAIDVARSFPSEAFAWQSLYEAMIDLRNTLEVATSGNIQAMDMAAESFRSVPSQVSDLLGALKLPDVKALQAKLKLPQSGVIDGPTFLALELMLLKADAIEAGAMNGAAASVATKQVTRALDQASFVRDLKGTDILTAVTQGKLSAQSQAYLLSQGYKVEGQKLVNPVTGEAVSADALPALGAKLVKDATDTLMYNVSLLNKDEAIHKSVLSGEQLKGYMTLRKALDGILTGTGPTSSTDAVAQIVVARKYGKTVGGLGSAMISAATDAATFKAPAAPPQIIDKTTLERWRKTGMTQAELDGVPEDLRAGLKKFLTPGADGHYKLQMSDGELEQTLAMLDFAEKPPTPAAQVLVNDMDEVVKQLQTVQQARQALEPDLPPYHLDPTDLKMLSASLAILFSSPATTIGQELIAGSTFRLPPVMLIPPKGKLRKLTASGGAAWGPKIKPLADKRKKTVNGATGDGDLDPRSVSGARIAVTKPQETGPKFGFAPLALIKDEQEYTARLSAKRFAQQVRNQQLLETAAYTRETYKASVAGPGSTAGKVTPPPPQTPPSPLLPE